VTETEGVEYSESAN